MRNPLYAGAAAMKQLWNALQEDHYRKMVAAPAEEQMLRFDDPEALHLNPAQFQQSVRPPDGPQPRYPQRPMTLERMLFGDEKADRWGE